MAAAWAKSLAKSAPACQPKPRPARSRAARRPSSGGELRRHHLDGLRRQRGIAAQRGEVSGPARVARQRRLARGGEFSANNAVGVAGGCWET